MAVVKMDRVDCSRGAPMGRWESHDRPLGPIRLFRVDLDMGGYDNGGAYWGRGQSLFQASDASLSFRVFFRADDREAAKKHLHDTYPDYTFTYMRAR